MKAIGNIYTSVTSLIRTANHVPAPSSMQFTADPCLHESIFFPAMTSWAEMKLGRNEKPSWRFIVNYLGNILLEFGHRMIPHFSRIWDGFSFRPSFISAHDVIAGKKMDSAHSTPTHPMIVPLPLTFSSFLHQR